MTETVSTPTPENAPQAEVSSYDKLTPKQRAFVNAYIGIANGNATKAAIKAGYSEKTAHNIGWENVRKPDIKAAIAERYRDHAMTAEEVLGRLAAMARATIADAFVEVLEVELDGNGRPCEYDAETGIGIPTKAVKRLSVEEMERTGLIHCVAEARYGEFGLVVKLHDQQAALDKIARALGVYSGEGMTVSVVFKDSEVMNFV